MGRRALVAVAALLAASPCACASNDEMSILNCNDVTGFSPSVAAAYPVAYATASLAAAGGTIVLEAQRPVPAFLRAQAAGSPQPYRPLPSVSLPSPLPSPIEPLPAGFTYYAFSYPALPAGESDELAALTDAVHCGVTTSSYLGLESLTVR